MIARLLASLAVAVVLFACASIDPPAVFDKPDAVADVSFTDAGRCGRILPRRFTTDVRARLHGDPSGAAALCVTLELEVTGAGTGQVTFCVAGDLDDVTVPTVREVSLDEARCAYCVDVRTNCTKEAGPETCGNRYAPTSGRVRIVRLGRAADADVWIDVGNLTVARVDRESDASVELELRDCLFADGLTFQGKVVVEPTCSADTFECRIASSASSRFP